MFIACSAASIVSAVPLGSTLDHSNYLSQLATSDSRVVVTVLLQFVWAVTGAGIAIGLYPVLRRFHPALALGSVAGRVVENVFVLASALSLLGLQSVSERAVASGDPSSFRATGDALLAVRDWALHFMGPLAFGAGALMYYYAFYRSRLVPRWLSIWGLIGGVLALVATVSAGFTQDFGFTTVNTVLNMPIGFQEMVLAVWLIVKGFTWSESTAASVGRATVPTGGM